MNKNKTTMSKETEKTLENMKDSDLKCLLDEVCSYKHTGDMQGKSPLVQGLLRQAEESESGEESIKRPPKRHKKPKERRRRKESDSLAARTHAGGSLDNIGGDKAQTAAARQRGVAGRTREGGSCCNLSRGSFETTVARRRRRRDPHRQHGGSLEDLSAIDETVGGSGRAKSSVSESGKHGGSLQNINQEGGGDFRPPAAAAAAAAAAATATAAAAAAVAFSVVSSVAASASSVGAAAGPPAVIDIDAEGAAAARPAGGSRGGSAEPGRLPNADQAPPDATVDFSLQLDPRQQAPPARPAPYTAGVDIPSVERDVSRLLAVHPATYTKEDVKDMPPGEPLGPSSRRLQPAAESGGTGLVNGQRPGSSGPTSAGKGRKGKKKGHEEEQLTQNVDGYRGKEDLEDLLGFIESGDKKDKNGNKKSDKAKEGKKDAKGRKPSVRSGEEDRSSRGERSGGRGHERRPSGRGATKPAPSGRSSSLEARPAPAAAADGAAADGAAGRADGTSVFCGDLAKSSLKKSDSTPAGPTVVAFDGGTYVSPPAAERDSEGFVQDFYSVTTDSTPIEETEFHVVTRKQRRRGGARAGAADSSRPHALRHKTNSLDDSARAAPEPPGQPRRPYVPGQRHVTSSSAPHSELSDSDSDGAGSPPPPPPPSLGDAGGGRAGRASPPPNVTPAAAVATPAPAPAATSSGGSGGSSWADVTRSRQESQASGPAAAPTPQRAAGTRDAGTSTDFIDGVGPIFGERASPRGRPVAAVAAFVRGASEPADGLIGGSHPDEFPEIAPAPAPAAAAAAAAAAKSPRAGSAAPAAAAAAVSSAPASGAVSVSPSAAAAPSEDPAGGAGVAVTVPAASADARADRPPAAPAPAAAATLASRDTGSAVSGNPASPVVPTAPSSDANNAAERPAPAASAGRRTKKAPAVTIRGTLEASAAPGAASAQVQGIQFGYIDQCSEPCAPPPAAAAAAAAAAAVDAFCRRFRPPVVDVSRFNWAEIVAYLSKVYEEAARDPAVFFAARPAVQNGVRPAVPAAAGAPL